MKNIFQVKDKYSLDTNTQLKRALLVCRYKSVQIIRGQFLIRAAADISYRRYKEDTMDSAVVDFNVQCFQHCNYVSLSKEKKIETLFIRDLNERKNSY